MLARPNGVSLPGWRDFERAIAEAFDGINQENKSVFDVLISDQNDQATKYGISCKMRQELRRVERDGLVTIELSNSVKAFKSHLAQHGLPENRYKSHSYKVGVNLVQLVESWKDSARIGHGSNIDLAKSCYLSLQYDLKNGNYQLFWFSAKLPDPTKLKWSYPQITKKGISTHANHLNGDNESGVRVFEWYSESGGQLKYYPQASTAIWKSNPFQLEKLTNALEGSVLRSKAKAYFPQKWRLIEG